MFQPSQNSRIQGLRQINRPEVQEQQYGSIDMQGSRVVSQACMVVQKMSSTCETTENDRSDKKPNNDKTAAQQRPRRFTSRILSTDTIRACRQNDWAIGREHALNIQCSIA